MPVNSRDLPEFFAEAGGDRPVAVFEDERECRRFQAEFRATLAPTVRIWAEARRQSEEQALTSWMR